MPRKPTGQGSGGGRPMKHGLRKLEDHLLGNKRRLDRRGRIAKLWKSRALDWAEDGGGVTRMSARQQTLLWHTAAVSLMVDSILEWAFTQPSLLDENRELLAPLRKSLITYLNAERRGLEALGLRPESGERLPTLQEYIEAHARNTSQHDQNGAEGAQETAGATNATRDDAKAEDDEGAA